MFRYLQKKSFQNWIKYLYTTINYNGNKNKPFRWFKNNFTIILSGKYWLFNVGFYDAAKYKSLLEDLLSIILKIFQTYELTHIDKQLIANSHM